MPATDGLYVASKANIGGKDGISLAPFFKAKHTLAKPPPPPRMYDYGIIHACSLLIAKGIKVEGLEWQYESGADGNITITGLNNRHVTGDVIIPATIEGRPVTSIGRCALRYGAFDGGPIDCKPIISDGGPISVVIPNGVISIGNFAFSGCHGLRQVVIPDSVRKIGIGAFSCCDGLTSVEIPGGVTEIGERAFEDCEGLTRVIIKNGVTGIGFGSFNDCYNLVSVLIPDSMIRIGDHAFCNCHELTSITIPDSVVAIGECAFRGCRGLMRVSVPVGIRNVGQGAFDLYPHLEV